MFADLHGPGNVAARFCHALLATMTEEDKHILQDFSSLYEQFLSVINKGLNVAC